MEPLYFGASSQLYGVLHTGTPTAGEQRSAALLCSPAGQEYMRFHRATRWLAQMLTRKGHACLRYDYPGQGDSLGEFDEQTLADWRSSADVALDELDHLLGRGQRTMVGIRIGALISATLCAQRAVDNLILWEPRVKGQMFVDEMERQIKRGIQPRSNYYDEQGNLNFNGYRFSAEFLQSLQAVDLRELDYSKVGRTLLVSYQKEGTLNELVERITQTSGEVECVYAEGPGNWNTVDQIGGMVLPQAAMRVIDQWIG